MPYRIETFDAGVQVGQLSVGGSEEEAINHAKAMPTPEHVDFVRVVEVLSESASIEIWSERRDA